jgi:cysteine desulfurase / selenocysteine lyase
MSTIPNSAQPSAPEAVGAPDLFGTDLISRLANEIYRGAQSPVGLPLAPASSASGLNSGLPPVHPTDQTLVAKPAESPLPHTGGADTADTHPFGEPRCKTAPPRRNNTVKTNASEASAPGLTPEYYFLQVAHSPEPARAESAVRAPSWNIDAVRQNFPALQQEVNGRPLVWLDNAATTHKPQAVIDATSEYYARDNSNIHRAAHTLAARSTELFEATREKTRRFLGAADAKEIVFVRGTTEGINLVAQSYGRKNFGVGDEIILTELEHHANIVPWQLVAAQTGAVIRVIPINDRGELVLEEYVKLLSPRTKFVSVAHVSNSLGTINPVEEIIKLAHGRGVPVLVDGAQSVPHMPVNVTALDADFFVFSAHKLFGPTGIGILYGKAPLLEAMPPWQGGGHMIRDVRFDKTVYQNAPEKFEAGTPDIAGVVGLGAALDYLARLGLPAIAAHEHSLLDYATAALSTISRLRLIGTALHKASVLSFIIPGLPNENIARHLDKHGIAVRAGHHCAQPAQRHFGLESTVRPSLAFYNNHADVDALVHVLRQLTRNLPR